MTKEQTTPTSEFRYIDGRRYHNVESAKYFLPNDDDELDRLHLQHFIIRHIFQGNFSAPVEHILNGDGLKVLDVGCGAGSWMFEMAADYPKIKITGVDISPIQPANIGPTNVSFVRANLLTGLPFEDNTFDYVFQRLLFTAIPSDDWPNIIKELTRVLKPGGYLELSELGPSCRIGPVTTKFLDAANELFTRRNLDHKILYKLQSFVEQNGQFEDINEEKKLLSYGAESGNLAQMALTNVKTGICHMKPFILPILGVTTEEFDEMLNVVIKELKDYKSYQDIIRVYARKKENF